MKVFGPIPSRRLGRSLGINNIPPKICTYSCIYCQLGRAKKMDVERGVFYEAEEIVKEAQNRVVAVHEDITDLKGIRRHFKEELKRLIESHLGMLEFDKEREEETPNEV